MTLILSLRLFRRNLSRHTIEISQREMHVYALMQGAGQTSGKAERAREEEGWRCTGMETNDRRALPGTWRVTRWWTWRERDESNEGEERGRRGESGRQREGGERRDRKRKREREVEAICHATRRMFGGTNKFPLAGSTFHGDLGKTGWPLPISTTLFSNRATGAGRNSGSSGWRRAKKEADRL